MYYPLKTSRAALSTSRYCFRLFTNQKKETKNIHKIFFSKMGRNYYYCHHHHNLLMKAKILKVTWDPIWQVLVHSVPQTLSPLVQSWTQQYKIYFYKLVTTFAKYSFSARDKKRIKNKTLFRDPLWKTYLNYTHYKALSNKTSNINIQ